MITHDNIDQTIDILSIEALIFEFHFSIVKKNISFSTSYAYISSISSLMSLKTKNHIYNYLITNNLESKIIPLKYTGW